MRRLVALLVLILWGSGCFLPAESARADTQAFPLPAFGVSKNDGTDAGLIVPILVTEPDGDGTAREPGELASLDGQRLTTELRLEDLRQGRHPSLCVEEATTRGRVSLLRCWRRVCEDLGW